MSTKYRSTYVPMIVRLPEGANEALKVAAKIADCSMNDLIVDTLCERLGWKKKLVGYIWEPK